MFAKITARKKPNKTYYYAELVEGYRKNGKVMHKRVSYIGAVTLDTANRLKKAFSDKNDNLVNINDLEFNSSVDYGHFQYIYNLFNESGMFKSFEKAFEAVDSHITIKTALEYIKIMIIHRIIEPGSKLALTEWLEHTPYKFFFDIDFDLQSLYRSLDVLEKNISYVEDFLYKSAINLFNQNRDELFYDITSSYMEGHKCIIAKYGYSRDHRKDREQVVIGLVTTYDGFPVKCNIHTGNTVDKTTVESLVTELKNQFKIDEFVFVGDRGMLTASNIEALKEEKQKFVMAIPREWTKKYLKDVSIDESAMDEVIEKELYSKFIEYKKDKSKSKSEDIDQFLLCLNIKKRNDDALYREKLITKFKNAFDDLNLNANKSNTKIKDKETLISKAAVLKKKKYGKYINLKYIDEPNNLCKYKVEYTINEKKVEDDKRLDGTFLIQTNTKKYDNKELIHVYKNLNTVESAFKVIKNELDIRPMYHRNTERVKGHIYLCVLSYYIYNVMEYKLKHNNVQLSAPKLLNKLRKISLVETQLNQVTISHKLTKIDLKDKELFNKMNIKVNLSKKKL